MRARGRGEGGISFVLRLSVLLEACLDSFAFLLSVLSLFVVIMLMRGGLIILITLGDGMKGLPRRRCKGGLLMWHSQTLGYLRRLRLRRACSKFSIKSGALLDSFSGSR